MENYAELRLWPKVLPRFYEYKNKKMDSVKVILEHKLLTSELAI